MLNKSESRKLLIKHLFPYFKKNGFKQHLDISTLIFNKSETDQVVQIFFSFYSDGSIGRGPLFKTFYEVEDYILNIGIPSNTLETHNKKEMYHLPTIELRAIVDELERRPLLSEADVEIYAKSFIRFYENDGLEFCKEFKQLPAILTRMVELKEQGKYWNGILSGGPEHLVKGLIISKLCNDLDFSKKYEWVDPLLSDIEEWQPYWEKYKIIIDGLEPKYNLDKA